MHPFEKAGLGIAPFKFVGVEEKRGPYRWTDNDGITHEVGSPGQPMGSCDYCGEGIAQCCHITSADGKQFIVGNVCVGKTGDKRLTKEVNRAIRKQTKEREKARIDKTRDRLNNDGALRANLENTQSPNGLRPDDSALDWAEWMMKYAGHTGRMKVVRFVDKFLKETLSNWGGE